MGSEWVVLVAGWLFVVVLVAPLWLEPLNERWTPRDVTWTDED